MYLLLPEKRLLCNNGGHGQKTMASEAISSRVPSILAALSSPERTASTRGPSDGLNGGCVWGGLRPLGRLRLSHALVKNEGSARHFVGVWIGGVWIGNFS